MLRDHFSNFWIYRTTSNPHSPHTEIYPQHTQLNASISSTKSAPEIPFEAMGESVTNAGVSILVEARDKVYFKEAILGDRPNDRFYVPISARCTKLIFFVLNLHRWVCQELYGLQLASIHFRKASKCLIDKLLFGHVFHVHIHQCIQNQTFCSNSQTNMNRHQLWLKLLLYYIVLYLNESSSE